MYGYDLSGVFFVCFFRESWLNPKNLYEREDEEDGWLLASGGCFWIYMFRISLTHSDSKSFGEELAMSIVA